MWRLIWVGMGGIFGAVGRYVLSGLIYRWVGHPWYPVGTFAVNVLGCFVLGFLNGFFEIKQIGSPELRLFLLIGFLGSFTTFSTFAYETFSLSRDGQFLAAFSNVSLQIITGFFAVWFGNILAKFI